MNLKQLLHHFTRGLAELYDQQEIISIFNIAVGHVSGLSRTQLMMKDDAEVDQAKWKNYMELLDKLKAGMPLQYVIGETVFYGLTFKVNPSVLIPRPETEELVEWVLQKCRHSLNHASGTFSLIDIGTGSGCIAVTLKKNLPNCKISALDISKAALDTAAGNAIINEVDIDFIEADIRTFAGSHKFDVIVSNPPYITWNEKEEMHDNVVMHEPHLALFVPNEHPLIFYEAIADFARRSLHNKGLLFFEINEHLGKETVQMLADKLFVNIELKKDIQGKDRMICCAVS